MEVTLLDNNQRSLLEVLEEACNTASSVKIAVAFAKESAHASAPFLDRFADRGGAVRLLAGVDFELSDIDAVTRFDKPPSAARIYLHPEGSARRIFHPKVYLFEDGESASAIVGSSNLTAGGLSGNIEANVVLRGSIHDSVISSVRAYHDRLWNSAFSLPVTNAFKEHYKILQERRRSAELALRSEAAVEGAHRGLRLAIAEAVTMATVGSGRRNWLLITSPENFIRNIEGQIWGDERRSRIAQASTGDLIWFYIKRPVMGVGAAGMVTRAPYEDTTPHWHDGRVYPYRFGFVSLIRPTSPVPFRALVPALDLYGRTDDQNWGQMLQTSMIQLTDHDADILRVAVSAASVGATVA